MKDKTVQIGKIPAAKAEPLEDKLEMSSNQVQPLINHSILKTQQNKREAVGKNKNTESGQKMKAQKQIRIKKIDETYQPSITARKHRSLYEGSP